MLHYDPATGGFTWKHREDVSRMRNTRFAGKVAGHKAENGYVQIRIDGKLYYGHRIAHLIMTGKWPTDDIDHRSVDPSDTRWENQRPATPSDNQANTKIPQRNTSGLKGVSRTTRGKPWRAQIRLDGTTKYLGCFATREEAHAKYMEAAIIKSGEFARAG